MAERETGVGTFSSLNVTATFVGPTNTIGTLLAGDGSQLAALSVGATGRALVANSNLSQGLQYATGLQSQLAISRSVSSNQLTINVTHYDGTTPSTSNPLYIRVGNSFIVRTTALTATVLTTDNWARLGSAETTGLENDIFIYLHLNGGNIYVAWARFGAATSASTFNISTVASQIYLWTSSPSIASTDSILCIGRMNVILTATGGAAPYNWSLPGTAVINVPAPDRTRWLPFVSQFTGSTGVLPNNWTKVSYYSISENRIFFDITMTCTAALGGAASNLFTISVPMVYLGTSTFALNPATSQDAGKQRGFNAVAITTAGLNTMIVKVSNVSATSFNYSSTIPYTWTTSDTLQISGSWIANNLA